MIKVHYKPDKKAWEFWKKDRYLVEGEDFMVSHGRFVLVKPLKGNFECTYDVKN